MIIEVTQEDINKGQAPNIALARGASCPIARAVARTLGLPLTRVYAGSSTVEVRWVDDHDSASGAFELQRTFYELDIEGGNFMRQADNAHGCAKCDSPKPTTLVLQQHPTALAGR